MSRGRWTRLRPAAPLAAIVLVAFVATAIYAVPLDRFLVMPDELTYSKDALEIWRSPPLVGQGSEWFVSWSQLLPLLYAIPLGAADNLVDGVRIAHLIAALAMALTAVPAYLLALEVTGERRAGWVVAALCVSVPWMAMAGTLMTEVFAYPAFTWAAWATVRACRDPSAGHDAHAIIAALIAVFARAQLAFVPVVVAIAVLTCALREQRPLREHRVIVAAVALGGFALILRLALAGNLSGALGAYSTLAAGHSASLAIAGKLVAYVGVAIAGVPLILGLPWVLSRLLRRDAPAQFGFAVFSITSLAAVVFQASLELTQPGRLHDRYLVYALPLLFTAMAGALLAPRVLTAGTIATGLLFAALVSRYDFFETGAELPSLSYTLHGPINDVAFAFGDISPGWFLAGLIIAITALLALVLREYARQALLLISVPVLLFCAVETVDAFRQIGNSYYGFGYVEPRPRNWIDRIVPAGADVAAIVGQAGDPLATPLAWWDIGYWNKSVQRYYVPPGPRPARWGQPATRVIALDKRGQPLDRREWWVIATGDPKVRVEGGRPVARAGELELVQATPAAPLRVIR